MSTATYKSYNKHTVHFFILLWFYSFHTRTRTCTFISFEDSTISAVCCAVHWYTAYTIVQLTHFSALKCNDNIQLGHYRSHFGHYGIAFEMRETKMTTKQETTHKNLSISSSSSQARLHLNTIPVFMFRIYMSLILAPKYIYNGDVFIEWHEYWQCQINRVNDKRTKTKIRKIIAYWSVESSVGRIGAGEDDCECNILC